MRKFHLAIIMMIAACIMGACDEHQEVIDLTLKVGNVYRGDGTIVPVQYHMQQGEAAPIAIGVLVAVGEKDDNYAALIMALEDLEGRYWFTAKTADTKVNTDLVNFNGKENTTILLSEYAEDETLDPMGAIMAGAYRAGGVAGWHLPSVAEMMEAAKNRQKVEESLRMLNAKNFDNEWYLTSTADGTSDETALRYNYCVIMPEGRIVGELKTEKHNVRPFMIIK